MKILTQTIRAIQTSLETPKYPIASLAYAGALDKLPIFLYLGKYCLELKKLMKFVYLSILLIFIGKLVPTMC